MKILKDLIALIIPLETKGDLEVSVSGLSLNSKDVASSHLFVALAGEKIDGHEFIEDAIKNGASVVVHEKELIAYHTNVTYVRVASAHRAIGEIAHAFYDFPSEKLKLVGVTGTNGKTTTTTLLHQLYRNMDFRCGLIGTVAIKINDQSNEVERTTPDAITLNKTLARMVDHGCEICFMEVSSHAISQNRISGLSFAGGVFTNLTHDHLDYHKTIEEYALAKKHFFDLLPREAFALSNRDDSQGVFMLRDTKAKKYFYGLKEDSAFYEDLDFNERLENKLIGEFNNYNILACFATAVLLDEDRGKVKSFIKDLDPVEGRFNYFKTQNNITCIVDYAHTPDALMNVLKTVQDLEKQKEGTPSSIITVVGCGGDRDKTKRPVMARIAFDMSDILVLTSDNPRTEDAISILNEMKKGLSDVDKKILKEKVFIIEDRREAILRACSIAREGDFIMVAGKGHEKYQEINGVKNHFDDMEELKNYFNIV
jgi:UDP-N-acetylmuramoyl-L-alanyl-D-glutamate--2,6-diaminopimelate ligase